MHKAKYYSLFIFLLVVSTRLMSQANFDRPALSYLKKKEDSLAQLGRQIVEAEEAADRFRADSQFTRILVRSLRVPNSFYFPFDSLATISRLYAPDSTFRIFTWQVSRDADLHRRHGAIQMRTADGSLKLFPLIDRSIIIKNQEDTVTNHEWWIGAIYYKILKNVYNNKSLSKSSYPIRTITLESSTSDILTFSSFPNKHGLSPWSDYSNNPEGYVSITGDLPHTGGYKVLSVIDEYRFTIENKSINFSSAPIVWKMQKAQSRNLLDGLYTVDSNTYGIRIDIVHSGITDDNGVTFLNAGSFIIRINDFEFNSKLQFIPKYSEWYGMVVNLSNICKQISINAWELNYNPDDTLEQSSNLNSVHQDIRSFIDNFIFDSPKNPQPNYLAHSNSYFEIGASGGIVIEKELNYYFISTTDFPS